MGKDCGDRRKKVGGFEGSIGGHFSTKKTRATINRSFTWPSMPKKVRVWCSTCPEYQKAQQYPSSKAPLQSLPIIETPFHRVAFDLVFPLPMSGSGYKYILTSMCFASKYPEAITLKKVDAPTVAEALH